MEAAHKLKHKKPSAKNPDKAVAARVAAADFAAAVSAAEAELAEGAVTELEATGNKWNKARRASAPLPAGEIPSQRLCAHSRGRHKAPLRLD